MRRLQTSIGMPVTYICDVAGLPEFHQALQTASQVAIDTETPMSDDIRFARMRVMSVALRQADGSETTWVIDVRDLPPERLAPILTGVTADAWNANFDAGVIDRAVFQTNDTTSAITWWDGQLADALLHQGQTGFTWFHGLAWATDRYLGITAQGKGTTQLSYTMTDDLNDEQIIYAAEDAHETLHVCDAIRQGIKEAGLERICDIEMAARPFLDRMERHGLPLDVEGWSAELTSLDGAQRDALNDLAILTGGGQASLFDDAIEASWNPASDRQVRDALNTWAPDAVRAWARSRTGTERLLSSADSMNKHALAEIGGDLVDAILSWRALAKITSTYGDSLVDLADQHGRLHSRYLQVVGTNTGRLASRNPNAQNLTPQVKPFLKPPDPSRVFVHADLSQAELRYLAQVSNDEALRRSFATGIDVHVATASTMFGFEPEELRVADPTRFAALRQTAKALNFGIAYGQGAAALGRALTSNGAETTTDQARTLLAQYKATYSGASAWADERDASLREISATVSAIDWTQSIRLASSFGAIRAIRREFRSTASRWPEPFEVAEQMHPGTVATAEQIDHISWVASYSGAVALMRDGRPFTFSSYTLAGRRQQFNISTESVFLQAAILFNSGSHPDASRVRVDFETEHDVVLHRPGRPFDESAVRRVFDERTLRHAWVDTMRVHLGDDETARWLERAARERVLAMINAWRNAPIQGGVADIMLLAYGDLQERLLAFPDTVPVQTVHDSVVIECPAGIADAVLTEVRSALESAMVRICPSVTPGVDIDIRSSLSDKDVVAEDTVAGAAVQPGHAPQGTGAHESTDSPAGAVA